MQKNVYLFLERRIISTFYLSNSIMLVSKALTSSATWVPYWNLWPMHWSLIFNYPKYVMKLLKILSKLMFILAKYYPLIATYCKQICWLELLLGMCALNNYPTLQVLRQLSVVAIQHDIRKAQLKRNVFGKAYIII